MHIVRSYLLLGEIVFFKDFLIDFNGMLTRPTLIYA